MNLDKSHIYEELRAHIDTFPIGFPTTKSGVELEILKYLFTPEEAKIASNLKFSWSRDLESLDTIYERIKNTGISREELEKNLDNMIKKGTIHFKKEGADKYYSNAQFLIGIYEFQVNRLNEEFLKNYFI